MGSPGYGFENRAFAALGDKTCHFPALCDSVVVFGGRKCDSAEFGGFGGGMVDG